MWVRDSSGGEGGEVDPFVLPLCKRGTKGDLNPPQPSFRKGGRATRTQGDSK